VETIPNDDRSVDPTQQIDAESGSAPSEHTKARPWGHLASTGCRRARRTFAHTSF